MTTSTLYICTTCRAGQPDEPRPGARLYQALKDTPPDGVTVVGVECLSACQQGCAVALSGPGKWGYVYGRLGPDDAAALRDGAARHGQSRDGIVPWRERPEIFRKQSIARIPPLTFGVSHES